MSFREATVQVGAELDVLIFEAERALAACLEHKAEVGPKKVLTGEPVDLGYIFAPWFTALTSTFVGGDDPNRFNVPGDMANG